MRTGLTAFPELRPSKRALTMICSHIVLLGRDLRVQHGIEDARSVQSCAELDWQLHSHPWIGTARCNCGRSGLPGMCCSAQRATSACGPRIAQNGQERIGSWPLDHIRMANERKLSGYDFHFNFGKGTHNSSQGEAENARVDGVVVARLRPLEHRSGV
ncbi:MAG: hypothetical protein QOD84_1318 [Acidobacteriaceae bacterium]